MVLFDLRTGFLPLELASAFFLSVLRKQISLVFCCISQAFLLLCVNRELSTAQTARIDELGIPQFLM